MVVLTYNPGDVTLIVGGVEIVGFADDEFILIERDEDAFIKKVGVAGEVTRLKNQNRAGKITFKLMQSSISNDELSFLAALDESQGFGAVPALARDLSGRSVFATPFAWVKRYPRAEYKKTVGTWTWVLDTASLLVFVGGNNA